MRDALVSVFAVTTLCMLSPGPDMVLVLRNTLAGGRRSGYATAGGVLTGNFVHIASAAFGIGWLMAQSRVLFDAVRYGGAAYLVILGIGGLRAALAPNHALAAAAGTVRPRAYRQGLLNNLLNAKGALFYLGVFTQLITPERETHERVVLVAAMVATSALFWLVFVALVELASVRAWLSRGGRYVDGLLGVALLLLAARVVMTD